MLNTRNPYSAQRPKAQGMLRVKLSVYSFPQRPLWWQVFPQVCSKAIAPGPYPRPELQQGSRKREPFVSALAWAKVTGKRRDLATGPAQCPAMLHVPITSEGALSCMSSGFGGAVLFLLRFFSQISLFRWQVTKPVEDSSFRAVWCLDICPCVQLNLPARCWYVAPF